jgi:prepilin-type N-terminal cleavage/methylation domain-containing protein
MIRLTRLLRRSPVCRSQAGFTIVELMIATAVLSVILLLTTLIIGSMGDLYYKGVNQSRTQDDVRTITEDVSQHLQLSDQTPVAASATFGGIATKAYCIDGTRYSYVLNRQIGTGSTQITHVLWRDSFTGTCTPLNLSQATPSANGSELISSNSELTAFTVTLAANQPYTVSVGVGFGDPTQLSGSGITTGCKSGAGDQFCATSSLTTTVVKRLN